jgi:hypothetical protein
MGLGSGIRKKSLPDPGPRGQKGTGSRIRIRNTVSTNDACFCFTTILHHAQPGAAIAYLLAVQDLDAYKSVSGVYIVRTHFVKPLFESVTFVTDPDQRIRTTELLVAYYLSQVYLSTKVLNIRTDVNIPSVRNR